MLKVKFTTQPITEMDVKESSKFIYNFWKKQGWIPDFAIKDIKIILKELIDWSPKSKLISVYSEGGELLGWLINYIRNETTIEINPWGLRGHPIILSEKYYEIAKLLIKKAIDQAYEDGFSRIELIYPVRKEEDEAKVQEYKQFYEALNFTPIAILGHVTCNLNEKMNVYPLREEITINTLTSMNEEQLFNCYKEIFRDSEGNKYADLTEEEIRSLFKEVFECRVCLIDEASHVFTKNDEIIAFSIVRTTYGENNGHIWMIGVHPKYRRQGIGQALLSRIKKTLFENGFKTASAGYDLMNDAADKLFNKLDFKPVKIDVDYISSKLEK
ncbi:MAG: GNAT family N-acetyltransferase [Candidatus Heimdallarchaeota archaeon]|nr:GNAT family N-acetyltransferase [Candidatus Heimdallarchaeota archaeon]